MTEVSIIVPVYGCENYIEKCIKSILDQSFEDFELVLIDDGSPDKSGEICDCYAGIDSRITVIHKKNGGVSSARNAGINVAKGKYIMFCDGDDFVEKNWCQNLFLLMQEKNVNIGICGYKSISNDGKQIISHTKYNNSNMYIKNEDIIDIYETQLLNVPWNKIYLKNIIQKNSIQFQEGLNYSEDLLFVIDYLKACRGGICITNETPYLYRRNVDNSLTYRYIPNYWGKKIIAFKKLEELFTCYGVEKKHRNSVIAKAWCWPIVDAISYTFHKDNPSGLKEKIMTLSKILNSNECKSAFAIWDFCGLSSFYKYLLKSRSVFGVSLYNIISGLKRHR